MLITLLMLQTGLAGEVELLYTGSGSSFAVERYTFEAGDRIAATIDDAGGTLVDVRTHHAVLSQEGWIVWSDQGLDSLLEAVEAGPSCDGGQLREVGRTPTEWILLPPSLHTLEGVDIEQTLVRSCTGGLWLAGPADGLPTWSTSSFDIRRAHPFVFDLDGSSEEVLSVGLPRQGAARRVQAVRDAMVETPDAVYLDVGGFVPGASSRKAERRNAYRDASFGVLASLNPVALVPGPGELAFGAADLLAEAARHDLPYVAANWVATEPALQLPPYIRRQVAGTDVAFVGWVDVQRVEQSLGSLHDITLTDDIAVLQGVVDQLLAADAPQLVVLMTQGSPEYLASLRYVLHGVDVVIGDNSAATLRVEETRTRLRPVSQRDHAAPVTLPLDGLARATLVTGETGLVEVRSTPIVLSAERAPDPAIRAMMAGVRAELYPPLDRTLIPAENPLEGVTSETWERLVCEATLAATGADAAFLPTFGWRRSEPGPLTVIQAADGLATTDELRLVRIDGDRLVALMLSAEGEAPIQCGIPTGSRFPRVRGRPIDPDQSYVFATTDRAIRGTRLGALFAGGVLDRVGNPASVRPVLQDGEALLLRHGVMDVLERWSAEGGEDWPTTVVAPSHDPRRPTWVLRARRLALQVERFQGAGTQAYALVPETLINSPSSFTLGGEVDLSAETRGPVAWWDARVRLSYAQLTVRDSPTQETADDLRLSTSLSLPVATFPAKGLMPYAEVLYDSELTPVVDEAGTLPRQSDLSLTAGLSLTPTLTVRVLRLGAFVNRDLGRLDDKSTEYGGRAELEAHVSLLGRRTAARAAALRLSTLGDLSVFGSTPADDAADLRLRFEGELRLTAGLFRGLGLSTYARTLVVQGRVPETLDPAASFTLGAAFDFVGALSLRPRGSAMYQR